MSQLLHSIRGGSYVISDLLAPSHSKIGEMWRSPSEV